MLIRQSELEHLKQLIQRMAQSEKEYRALRANLLERARQGAGVESGPWQLSVKEQLCRSFSEEQVERLLGRSEAARLKELLTPRTQTIVKVVKARGGQS